LFSETIVLNIDATICNTIILTKKNLKSIPKYPSWNTYVLVKFKNEIIYRIHTKKPEIEAEIGIFIYSICIE
jgi:hypothetical protein